MLSLFHRFIDAAWATINLHFFQLRLFGRSLFLGLGFCLSLINGGIGLLGESGCIVQGGEVVSTKLVEGGSGSGLLAGKEGTYKARKEHLKSHLKSKFVFLFL